MKSWTGKEQRCDDERGSGGRREDPAGGTDEPAGRPWRGVRSGSRGGVRAGDKKTMEPRQIDYDWWSTTAKARG